MPRCRHSAAGGHSASALGVARRRVVHREHADALGCRIERGASRGGASPRARRRAGARALHARARAVRERDAGDSVGNFFQSPSQSGRGDPRPISPPRGAAAPLHLGGGAGAGETERRERQDRLGVDGTGARLEQTGRRAALPRREASMRDEFPSHAGRASRAASSARPSAPRRGGAALHLHRVRRGFGRGRGVEGRRRLVPVLSRNRTVGSREAGVSVKARKGEKAKVAATRREPKRSCSNFRTKTPDFLADVAQIDFARRRMLRVVRRKRTWDEAAGGAEPEPPGGRRSALSLHLADAQVSVEDCVGRRKSQRPVEVARGAGRLLRTRRTLSNIFS